MENYFHSSYPDFVHGPGYGISRDAIHDLYTSALKQQYLKLEDVFFGLVAELLQIERIDAIEHYNLALDSDVSFKTKCDICNLRKTFTVHGIKPKKIYDLWAKFNDENIQCDEIEIKCLLLS